jgi:hypothetical protein
MTLEELKACIKCGESKPFDKFGKDNRTKSGRKSWCAGCCAAYQAEWRKNNPEAARAYGRKWKAANPEAVYQSAQAYKSANREKLRVLAKRWRESHPEERAEYGKAYRDKFPQKEAARRLLRKAVSNGTIIQAPSCVRCSEVGPTDGHHPDYSKPLEVTWLCRKCHKKEHAALGAETEKALSE